VTRDAEALRYHESGRKGKIEVNPTKPCVTQRDLSLAYTPGVAVPCRRIDEEPERVYDYTAKGNLVAVLSNGTAVLGLGDIGPLAAKPVMEGKGVLFKRFADIDVFDIEIDARDAEDVIRVAKALAPTFGGINLEDIKAPDCFVIEERLQKELDIPVFHDDQHGTAIISGAALLNALELVGKQLDEVRVVINGAGAAGIACADLYVLLGVKPENILMCDSQGVIHAGRQKGMNVYKQRYAVETERRTLADAMAGADVFVGVSVANVVTQDMVRSMAAKPIVFALANPDPEIPYDEAKAARPDLIIATGRSDYPNQVNNVLGFPFIFRGALDTRASCINREMKIAAVQALAALVREDVPDDVRAAYSGVHLEFGPDYIIPKPLDPRVLLRVAPAVARAAVATGVARLRIDLDQYPLELEKRLGYAREVVRQIYTQAARDPKTIVFPEGTEEKVIRACQAILDEGIARPILLGARESIEAVAREHHLDLEGIKIETPDRSPRYAKYCEELYRLRHRKGVTRELARTLMKNPNYFGSMAVHMGDADGLISGLNMSYPETIRPALRVISRAPGHHIAAGLMVVIFQHDVFFLADATVNIEPSVEQLVEIALDASEVARSLNFEPRVAMLSFSDFGSVKHPLAKKVSEAARILREMNPDLVVDGEMQADTAVEPAKLTALYPFSRLQSRANVLIFPDLQSGNIVYKLLQRLGGAVTIGPILMGLEKPVHVLERGCSVDAIVRMAAVAVIEAQRAAPLRPERLAAGAPAQ
jgi:malate dehydrogenase (oxaloacetate-decarboxylating)(NADP+)